MGSKCRVPDIPIETTEPATNLELGTKEPGTVEPTENLERTRNLEPNLEPRTRNPEPGTRNPDHMSMTLAQRSE